MSKRFLIALTVCLLATGGCNIIYKQNVQQGNALDQDDLDKLRLGMSQNQVAFLLGTPSIRDPFHHDRWDYVSSFSRRGGDAIMRKITLRFEDGALVEMTGIDPDAAEPARAADSKTEVEPVAAAPAPVVAGPDREAAAAPDINTIDTPEAQDQAFPAPEPGDVEAAGTGGAAVTTTGANWEIQLGAYDTSTNAAELATQLKSAGIDVYTVEQPLASGDSRFLVRAGGLPSRAAAEQLLDRLGREQGLRGYVVKPDRTTPSAPEQPSKVPDAPEPPEAVTPEATPLVAEEPMGEATAGSAATAEEGSAIAAELATEAPVATAETPLEPPATTAELAPEEPATEALTPIDTAAGSWQIQLGAFDLRENAANLVERLDGAGITAAVVSQSVEDGPDRYLVRSGDLQDRTEAETLLQRAREELGLYGFVVPPN